MLHAPDLWHVQPFRVLLGVACIPKNLTTCVLGTSLGGRLAHLCRPALVGLRPGCCRLFCTTCALSTAAFYSLPQDLNNSCRFFCLRTCALSTAALLFCCRISSTAAALFAAGSSPHQQGEPQPARREVAQDFCGLCGRPHGSSGHQPPDGVCSARQACSAAVCSDQAYTMLTP